MKFINNPRKAGFTLTELMIVVVVIGILVTIAIPNYARSVERAKCSQALHILKTMRSAALDYFRDNETFTGMTRDLLETQIGANFNDNNDWAFAVTAAAAGIFTITSTRLGGPHQVAGNTTIIINELDAWSGTYPKDNPGSW